MEPGSLRPEHRVVVVGAGPTGLGVAWRLQERGHENVVVLERADHAGGLASSFTDDAGYTWDIGGHVQFSHYHYFDALMDDLLGEQWLHHERESWVWIRDRFVPYPFQYNIRHLPEDEMKACLRGLLRVAKAPPEGPPANFEEWFVGQFGEGISDVFMRPYNFKVWAYPPSEMSHVWIGERVARVDIERAVFNVLEGTDDVSWGPNNTFRFPERGGTGEIWRRLAARLAPGVLRLGVDVQGVDVEAKQVQVEGGEPVPYDVLVSTAPLDVLAGWTGLPELAGPAAKLRHSRVHIVGVGVEGQPPPHLASKCWMYFPEDDCPFFRVTVFSNYSPNNVPRPGEQWSLMAEISESPAKPVDRDRVLEQTLEGMVATRLLEDREQAAHTWTFTTGHGYPTPFLGRDQVLAAMRPPLEARDIYSRGRFGAWKYEVSNQDHSLMQGVELVNHLLDGEREWTLEEPGTVNGGGKR